MKTSQRFVVTAVLTMMLGSAAQFASAARLSEESYSSRNGQVHRPRDAFTDGANNSASDPWLDGAHTGARDPLSDGARSDSQG